MKFGSGKINPEIIIVIFLIGSFFVGIWHAFPMLNVVGDEMYFVGGVLRAMENKTIIPAVGDVPYGTLTYYFNYVLIAAFLIILWPFFNFNVLALKDYLVQSPEIMYLVPRFLSSLLAIAYLFIFNKILKREIPDPKSRLVLILLLFTNMLTVLILHTGKMWVLSTLLVVVSFYYLYLAISDRSVQNSKINKHIFLSILFAFLAMTNLPINGYCLINILVLLIYFRQEKKIVVSIIKYSIIGLLVFILITLSNFSGIKNEVINIFTAYHPLNAEPNSQSNLGLAGSILLNLKKVLVFFAPLVAILLISIKDRIRNKKLFTISTLHFIAYLLTISFVANWSTGLYSYIRYLFPLAFFLAIIVASLNLKFNWFYNVVCFISLIYFFYTIYYLSVPTTFNQAYDWAVAELNSDNITIINKVESLQLPKNKNSYLINTDYHCASKCQNVITNDLNKFFKSLVVDQHTRPDFLPNNNSQIFFIEQSPKSGDYELIKKFGNNLGDGFNLDGRMANYFDLDFFRIKNFGADIYIYKAVK